MKKIVLTLLGFICAWEMRGQTLTVHNQSSFTLTDVEFQVANSTSCGWGIPNCNIPAGGTAFLSPSQMPMPLLGGYPNYYSAIGICDAWNPGTGQYCGYESWGSSGSFAPIAGGYMPQPAWTEGNIDVYVSDSANGGINPQTKVNMSACLTIKNTSDQTIYGFPQQQVAGEGGVQNNQIGCGPGTYMEIPPGQTLKVCDQGLQLNYSDVANGASATLEFVQVNMGGGVVDCNAEGPHLTAGDCVSLCNSDGSPYNPGGLTSSNVIATAPELPVSTNGVMGNGTPGSGGITIPDSNSGVVFNTNGESDILYSSTNALSVAQTGFDALYDVANKQLIELQQMNNNQMAESQGIESNATANANAIIAGLTNAVGGLRFTMVGLSNVIAQWGSGSGTGSNGPIIWTEPSSMSNQLGAIASSTALIVTNEAQLISNNLARNGYLADFSNALIQLNTNLQNSDSNTAYLAAISNNTAQPNRYTNVEFGTIFPTNAADIGNLGSNQVAGISQSLQQLGDTLKSDADSINGGGPGGDGSIYTVQAQVPGPSGGTVTYTFDMNPMDYPAIVDLAAFVRQIITWLVGIGFLVKIVGDISVAVGQMMSTAQGQVPRITILGNTVGWVSAGIYLIGIVAVMVGLPLLLVTYLTSNGNGPTLWAQIQTNPFSGTGYGAAVIGALWLADKFAPLYFVVATTLYYAAFRLYLIRLITIVAAIVRAFMA